MRIYTRKGDDGSTALYGGGRASKASARVEAYGTVDELNAVLGVARAAGCDAELDGLLDGLQRNLFTLGADLASPPDSGTQVRRLAEADVSALEACIDDLDGRLPVLKAFVLPGGRPAAAHLHHARTVARRAERLVVPLVEAGEVGPIMLAWLNRLSDLLFVLARFDNHWAGDGDVLWQED